ncbi:MAG: motility associated factor glycosyltransferase family protein [Treponema sp.]
MDVSIDVPILCETEGGEHTVQYMGRFLYSKRSPSSSIESLISSILSFENTLFVFASPVLGYGLSSLISKLLPSSFLLIVECDVALAKLFEKTEHKWQAQNVQYLHSSNMLEIMQKVDALTSFNFKKCVLVRASGGYALYQDFYNKLFQNMEAEVSNFWKNKITLIAMGRLYAKNIFKNAINVALDEKRRVHALKKSYVNKPVLVLGAGPSLDENYEFILKNRDSLFLLAVDVTLPALSSLSITPDAVLLLEGQYWVEASFLASSNRSIPLFTDITSNPHVFNIMQGNIFLYGSKYAKMQFLKDIQEVFSSIPFFDSVGSVGLLAIQIALFIAKEGMPIFHMGLDFSYGKGFSHSKGSSNWHNLMVNNNRLKSLYPSEIAFPNGVIKVDGKGGKKLFSTPILQAYASIYKRLFSHLPNIFDLSSDGVVLREVISKEVAEKYIEACFKNENSSINFQKHEIDAKPIKSYLKKEKQKLETLKNMLIGVEAFDENQFLSILKTCDYLYSHFPDSSLNTTDISFLKRIRIEIEAFYKITNCLE